MAESLTIMKNTFASIDIETTEGTLTTETNGGAVLLREDGLEVNIGRELLEEGFMTGSLTKTAPIPGMYSDDLGWTYPTFLRGKGTLTKPDYHNAMYAIMGNEAANTDNTVNASPAPTTAIVTTGVATDLDEGQLIRVAVGSGYEVTQIVDITGDQLTVWPPLSAAPSTGAAIVAGCNWTLSSTAWPTFSSFLHFSGNKRLTFAGCRPTSLSLPFEVGQRVAADFSIVGLTPTYTIAAPTTTPTLDTTTIPLICMGMTLRAIYSATTTGTPTTTQTILSATSFGAAIGDQIMIDAGSLGSPVTCTFTNGTELVNKVAHGLSNGDRVKFSNSGGALPTGLSNAIIYFVVNKNDDDFQVSLTSGGAAVTFDDDGSGTNSYLVWTKGTGNWETLAISNVSGDAGGNITLTHATATNRADSGDTVYLVRLKCAGIGDTLTITVEMEQELLKCMQSSAGKAGSMFTGRMVNIEASPYFNSWQEFLMRDNIVSTELMIQLGFTAGNIVALYMPSVVNKEIGLSTDPLMRVSKSAAAVKGTRLGNDFELVIAAF